MKARTKIFFYSDGDDKFFGEGPCRLLRNIEETGSLRKASLTMGLAYSKALRMISEAEKALGFSLTERTIGGKSGGGSRLTPEGREWLHKYEAYRDACLSANQSLYQSFFKEQPEVRCGCVIMASGLGRRFGGNKLMADFGGVPLIVHALDLTENLFTARIVVTRHKEVAELCRSRKVPVILHDFPNRNDTVRLGVDAIGASADHLAFLPGDQPLLKKESLSALLQAVRQEPQRIWRTCCGESDGAPVSFPKALYPELLRLPEGKGGNVVIRQHPELLSRYEVANAYELRDVDTPEDLEELLSLLS